MARYIGPVCRLCRREGEKLFLKGEKCFTKCTIEKRPTIPGQHGRSRRAKMMGFGLQLREKQKVKRIYGLLEKQFRLTFENAEKSKGITGERLLILFGTTSRQYPLSAWIGFIPSSSTAIDTIMDMCW